MIPMVIVAGFFLALFDKCVLGGRISTLTMNDWMGVLVFFLGGFYLLRWLFT